MPSGLGEALQDYVPSFRYLVDDLSHVANEELRQRALTAVAVLAAVCLRDMRTEKPIVDVFSPWVEELIDAVRSPWASADMAFVARYVYELREPEEVEAFHSFVEHSVGPEAKEIMVTAAEQLIRQGIEQGLEQGIEQGQVEGERNLLLKLLRQRFGRLDAETERRIAAATSHELDTWGSRVLSATTLDEVLAAASR